MRNRIAAIPRFSVLHPSDAPFYWSITASFASVWWNSHACLALGRFQPYEYTPKWRYTLNQVYPKINQITSACEISFSFGCRENMLFWHCIAANLFQVEICFHCLLFLASRQQQFSPSLAVCRDGSVWLKQALEWNISLPICGRAAACLHRLFVSHCQSEILFWRLIMENKEESWPFVEMWYRYIKCLLGIWL